MQKILEILSNKKTKPIVRLIIKILCCLLAIEISKVLFIMIGAVGSLMAYLIGETFRGVFLDVWYGTIKYGYLLFSLELSYFIPKYLYALLYAISSAILQIAFSSYG